VTDAVRRFGADIVHVQYPTLGYCGDLAARLPAALRQLRVPVVQTWHESFPLYFPVRIGWATQVLDMGLAPGDVIVVRPDYRRRMRWWYRIVTARKRFHLIPNAPTVPKVTLTGAERAALRARYAPGGKALLVFFGFFFKHKGIDEILEIMDPDRHHLLMVGTVNEADPYQSALLRRLREPALSGSVSLCGFLPAPEAARILAAADAVVLPFRHGGGSWNTSIGAAVLQGTFVLSTSNEAHGFDPERNLYYARPRDTVDLRQALDRYLGHRASKPPPDPAWPEIARRHWAIYEHNLAARAQ
jgi:glycosyltransferase involved in cell wall biosynthesis